MREIGLALRHCATREVVVESIQGACIRHFGIDCHQNTVAATFVIEGVRICWCGCIVFAIKNDLTVVAVALVVIDAIVRVVIESDVLGLA